MKPENENKVRRHKAKNTPLPVGLTPEQHKYLEGTGVGKAAYMRHLLIEDMKK